MTKELISGLIAVILLALYVLLSGYGVWLIISCSDPASCVAAFNPQMVTALGLISGLVSALVVAQLALTERGEIPLERATRSASRQSKSLVKWLVVAYLASWLVVGLATFVVGTLLFHNRISAITNLGSAWLGTALVAAYAYFGLNPPQDVGSAPSGANPVPPSAT